MNGKPWVAIAVVVVALGGLGFTIFRPAYFPNVLVASDADPVTIDQVRGERPTLVLAMVVPGDAVSKAALTQMSAGYEKYEPKASFAGLVFGSPAQAAAWQKELQLPFPLYAVSPQENPVEYNQIVKTLGGFRNRFYVGTVVVLSSSRRISQQVNGNELENLSATLAKL
jgi:hypothetical protein